MMHTAFENGERVRVVWHEHADGTGGREGSDGPRSTAIPWPNAEEPAMWLSTMSAAEAVAAAQGARAALMAGIGGAGLEPVWIAMRTLEASMYAQAAPVWPELEDGRLWRALMDGYGRALPLVAEAVHGADWRRAMARAQAGIRGVVGRHGWTPERAELPWVAGPEGSREEEEVAAHARASLLRWLCTGGSAGSLAPRWYAMAWAGFRSTLGPLSGEDIGRIFGLGRATVHEWIQRWLIEPVQMITGERIQLPGMKPEDSLPGYADNARRHRPRRRLMGAAGVDARSAAGMDAEEVRLAKVRLAKQQRDWARRQVERDAGEFEIWKRSSRESKNQRSGE